MSRDHQALTMPGGPAKYVHYKRLFCHVNHGSPATSLLSEIPPPPSAHWSSAYVCGSNKRLGYAANVRCRIEKWVSDTDFQCRGLAGRVNACMEVLQPTGINRLKRKKRMQVGFSTQLFWVCHDIKENIGIPLDAKIKPPVPRHPCLPSQYTSLINS